MTNWLSLADKRQTHAIVQLHGGRDGLINGQDLGYLLGHWGLDDADLNGDGTTNGADLTILLGGWAP